MIVPCRCTAVVPTYLVNNHVCMFLCAEGVPNKCPVDEISIRFTKPRKFKNRAQNPEMPFNYICIFSYKSVVGKRDVSSIAYSRVCQFCIHDIWLQQSLIYH